MHGTFDLRKDDGEDAFRRAFEAFAHYLKKTGAVSDWRFMRYQEHHGYNAPLPTTLYYVSIEFPDMKEAERCWNMIEQNADPLKSLHADVFNSICNSSFSLTKDVDSQDRPA